MVEISAEARPTIELVLYGFSILFPSIISIFAVARRAYFKKTVTNLYKLFAEQKTENEKEHKSIMDNIKNCSISIESHTQTIKGLLLDKNIATRIRQIIKHAIDYCRDGNLSKIMDNSAQQLIVFAKEVLEVGLWNITKEQLLAKYWNARDNCLMFGKSIVGEEMMDIWHKKSLPIYKRYAKYLIDISEDIVNNKEQRFLIKLEDLTQTMVRQFIMFTSQKKYREYLIKLNGKNENDTQNDIKSD